MNFISQQSLVQNFMLHDHIYNMRLPYFYIHVIADLLSVNTSHTISEILSAENMHMILISLFHSTLKSLNHFMPVACSGSLKILTFPLK
jgi:hypothetical protein